MFGILDLNSFMYKLTVKLIFGYNKRKYIIDHRKF